MGVSLKGVIIRLGGRKVGRRRRRKRRRRWRKQRNGHTGKKETYQKDLNAIRNEMFKDYLYDLLTETSYQTNYIQ